MRIEEQLIKAFSIKVIDDHTLWFSRCTRDGNIAFPVIIYDSGKWKIAKANGAAMEEISETAMVELFKRLRSWEDE